MRRRVLRVYADTSVYGGVFDPEFGVPSGRFFDSVRRGVYHLVVSDLVRQEIQGAPQPVRSLFDEFLANAEVAEVTEETLALRDAYLSAQVVSPNWTDDALHVALATVSRCAMILSWNFKHIVHYEKISLYNSVNFRKGHSAIWIFSPGEVVG